ncbi:MAG: DUF1566 domain-containing protein [Campylobacterota bacterium]|nr:DUF1566 domain-containing protein [Campylobacterota bacterium]
MIKTALVLTLSSIIASAWFMPNMSFGYGDDYDNTNVDKSYVRDDTKEIVLDSSSKRVYYDSTPSQKMHFFKAWEYCQQMDYLTHKDWRVPSKDELRSLLELSRRTITVKHAFKNVKKEKYWTSTEDRFEQAYYVDFDLGRYSTDKYTSQYRVICVRDSK